MCAFIYLKLPHKTKHRESSFPILTLILIFRVIDKYHKYEKSQEEAEEVLK